MDTATQYTESEAPRRFGNIARGAYLLGVLLALVLIIPTAWFPLELGKLAACVTCFVIAGIFFVLDGGMGVVLRENWKALSLTAILPLAYLLSFHFSINHAVGFFAPGFDVDTLSFVVLGLLALLLAAGLFRTRRDAYLLIGTIFLSLIAAALFQCVAVSFGTSVLPFQAFADRSVNVIGKWNDLGLLMGLLILWALLRLELSASKLLYRISLIVLVLLSIVLLGLIHFSVIWGMLTAFSVLLAAALYFAKSVENPGSRFIPWYALLLGAVSILFLVFGSGINASLTKVFPVSSIEVRPSYGSTLTVIGASHSNFGRILVGSGPDTFQQGWLINKPAAINASQFWSLDFNVGYSTLMTAFSDAGLLGAIGWLIPLVLCVLALVQLLRSLRPRSDKIAVATIALAAIYMWVATILYVPSQNLVLLAFVLSGGLLGLVYSSSQSSWYIAPLARVGVWVLNILLLVGLIWIAFGTDRLFFVETYVNKGEVALTSAGNIALAQADAQKALRYDKNNGDALRLSAEADLARLQQLASGNTSTAVQQQFVTLAQQAINEGKSAIAANPNDYRSYVDLGQIYDYLASLSVQGAYPSAESNYALAAQKDPTNPNIPLLQARLEAVHGNLQATQQDIKQALTLKPNYTDAILFVVQLDVAQKDIPNAIRATQAAIQTDPSDASIWFELGLLYYSNNDTADAILPLLQAVKLQSNYENAEYFLGLSYYAQKQSQNAIVLFKALQAANPNNAEVALILSNMEAGKPPFTSAVPPVTSTPQSRATAPISE